MQYLCFIHRIQGKDYIGCRSFLLSLIIRGGENLSLYSKEKSFVRNNVTLPVLKLLGHEIASSDWCPRIKKNFVGCGMHSFFLAPVAWGSCWQKVTAMTRSQPYFGLI